MTLESILDAGKKETAVKAVAEQFHQSPYLNILPILKQELGGVDVCAELGVDPSVTSRLTPAENDAFLSKYQKKYTKALIDRVNESFGEAATSLIYDGAFGRIVAFLAGIKPVKYEGVNTPIYQAHEKMYKVAKALENKDELVGKLMEPYKDDIMGDALIFLAQKDERLKGAIIHNCVDKAEKKLIDAIGNAENAIAYVNAMYANAGKAKDDVAYTLGKTLFVLKMQEEQAKESKKGKAA